MGAVPVAKQARLPPASHLPCVRSWLVRKLVLSAVDLGPAGQCQIRVPLQLLAKDGLSKG